MSKVGTAIRTIEGDTADKICWRYFGRTTGVTEQLLQNNPGLAQMGPIIPTGTEIWLPEAVTPPTKQQIQLWD